MALDKGTTDHTRQGMASSYGKQGKEGVSRTRWAAANTLATPFTSDPATQ